MEGNHLKVVVKTIQLQITLEPSLSSLQMNTLGCVGSVTGRQFTAAFTATAHSGIQNSSTTGARPTATVRRAPVDSYTILAHKASRTQETTNRFAHKNTVACPCGLPVSFCHRWCLENMPEGISVSTNASNTSVFTARTKYCPLHSIVVSFSPSSVEWHD